MLGTFPWGTFWSAMTALGTVAAVIAIAFAGRQIQLGALLEAQKMWIDKDFFNARRELFSRLDRLDQSWTPEEEAAGLDICRKLDDFAYVMRFTHRRRLLKVWGDPLAKSWLILKPLVVKERERTGFRDKWDGFGKIGEKALSVHPSLLEKTDAE